MVIPDGLRCFMLLTAALRWSWNRLCALVSFQYFFCVICNVLGDYHHPPLELFAYNMVIGFLNGLVCSATACSLSTPPL